MMAESRSKTGDRVTTAADRGSKSVPHQSAQATDSDIARRAYDLYFARGCEHGHDVDDWLKAERELQASPASRA